MSSPLDPASASSDTPSIPALPPHPCDAALDALRSWQWAERLPDFEARSGDADAALLLGWEQLERGDASAARAHLERATLEPRCVSWARTGLAAAALRLNDIEKTHPLLDAIPRADFDSDPILCATAAHIRGSALARVRTDERSLREFEAALDLCPSKHILRGRVLDSLGQHFASQGNFAAARDFFAESLKRRERVSDTDGIALAHGSLGRLMLDWGYHKDARAHFLKDLELIRGKDKIGEAQLYNYLGRIDLLEERLDDAAGWLDESALRAADAGAVCIEGFARKDRALVFLARGDLASAEEQLDLAATLLNSTEGAAHINRARALIRRTQGSYSESEELLRLALSHFDSTGEHAEAALTLIEESRTLRARKAPPTVLRHALERALDRAENCRRTRLVREAEAEMRRADMHQYTIHAYRRATGKNIEEDDVSLFEGVPETVTVLFMDLKNSTEFVVCHDPRWVLMTLNQIFADLDRETRKYNASVNQYLGDGFMAYFRGEDHARRAVSAGLELSRVIEIVNRPRALLNLPRFEARLGIASGEVVLGHVGTFRKFDFTAVGPATHLAARLQSDAEISMPCISRATYERVSRYFTFKNPAGRDSNLKGFGEQRVWDVVGMIGTQILTNLRRR